MKVPSPETSESITKFMYATTNSKHYAGIPNESLTCEWINETLDMQQEYAKFSSSLKNLIKPSI